MFGTRSAAPGWAARGGNTLEAAWEWLADAFCAEADAGRLAPWLPLGFGAGILVYFGAPTEPSIFAAATTIAMFAAIAWASRERPGAFAASLILLSVAAGFGAGCVRGLTVAHKTLTRPTGTLTVVGFVEARDANERSDRVVIRLTKAIGTGASRAPERVRVTLPRGTAPKVGDHISARAQLLPLLGPTRPGGFDYARNSYFAQIAGSPAIVRNARHA